MHSRFLLMHMCWGAQLHLWQLFFSGIVVQQCCQFAGSSPDTGRRWTGLETEAYSEGVCCFQSCICHETDFFCLICIVMQSTCMFLLMLNNFCPEKFWKAVTPQIMG